MAKKRTKPEFGPVSIEEASKGPWTRFMDMHSGGGQKEAWAYIYIQAPEKQANAIFYNVFGHNPNRVTCTCCGEDYSIDEHTDLMQASAYDRGCEYDREAKVYIEEPRTRYVVSPFVPFEQWLAFPEKALLIPDRQIKEEWRTGEIPEQGYVWVD